jgi:ligand-binding sensor domain-containing protein
VLILAVPVSASIVLFSPGSGSLSSLGIKDITDGPENTVLLATDNGRSIFNGTWEIVHVDRSEYQHGPLSDFVTALEYDHQKRLWIGYSNGLQILDGSTYTTINDQQLLKNLAINDLQCRGDEMWIATGHAGLHRYCGGIWTWFQPHGDGGLESYEIQSMAVDYVTGDLYCAADDGTLWFLSGDPENGTFSRIEGDGIHVSLKSIVSCPFGGIAGFNSTAVYRISHDGMVQQVLDASDLPGNAPEINDIAFTDEGTLVIGTGRGLVFWEEGTAVRRLTQEDGIGNQVIEHVYVDNVGRIWFFSRIYAGMYIPEDGDDPIGIAAPSETPSPLPANMTVNATPSTSEPRDLPGEIDEPAAVLDVIRALIDTFLRLFCGTA